MRQSSIASKSGIDYRVILAFASLLGVVFFISFSALTYRIGFPLDDAWIHQTYARNLARSGQLAFVHGVPSAGSTAPLWSRRR